jgi:hypothetical protein
MRRKRRKTMRTKAFLLIMSVMVAVIVSGCKKEEPIDETEFAGWEREQLYEEIWALQDEIIYSEEAYDELANSMEAAGLMEESTPAIGQINDGTGRGMFLTVDGTISFKKPWIYPESQEAADTSSISVNERISVRPGSNWRMKLSASRLELVHDSGVFGEITVGSLEDAEETYGRAGIEIPETEVIDSEGNISYEQVIDPSEDIRINENFLKVIVEPWVNEVPSGTTAKYNRIFLNDRAAGYQLKMGCLANTSHARIVCGMFKTGDYSCQYVFMYYGEQDQLKEEYISKVVGSISGGGGNNLVVGD